MGSDEGKDRVASFCNEQAWDHGHSHRRKCSARWREVDELVNILKVELRP